MTRFLRIRRKKKRIIKISVRTNLVIHIFFIHIEIFNLGLIEEYFSERGFRLYIHITGIIFCSWTVINLLFDSSVYGASSFSNCHVSVNVSVIPM